MKKPNSNKVIKAAKDRDSDRQRITLYLSKEAYEQFRQICEKEGVAPSKVVEEFMLSVADLNL